MARTCLCLSLSGPYDTNSQRYQERAAHFDRLRVSNCGGMQSNYDLPTVAPCLPPATTAIRLEDPLRPCPDRRFFSGSASVSGQFCVSLGLAWRHLLLAGLQRRYFGARHVVAPIVVYGA
ncbi:hypothetical protein N7456_007398 [Penicillium angulare]|uniref:Uncharacterized protein n=1 Tax=Penicillium angulare TaxID=116970 RepID=A0A9W9K969_9EURO|nr:hypothetical protein N7456_007398 [Penicillium angulare]